MLRPNLVCNAVDQDGIGIVDPGAHLTCFRTRDAPGQQKFAPQETTTIVNRLGVQRLRLKRATDLCVPSGQDGSPLPTGLGSYRCYRARPDRKTPRVIQEGTYLVDDFDSKPAIMLKPRRFCTPVDRDGAGVPVPDYDLTCYRVRDDRSFAKFGERPVAASNVFGTQDLLAKRAQCSLGAAIGVQHRHFPNPVLDPGSGRGRRNPQFREQVRIPAPGNRFLDSMVVGAPTVPLAITRSA